MLVEHYHITIIVLLYSQIYIMHAVVVECILDLILGSYTATDVVDD